MNREEAWQLLTEYNKDEFHLEHAKIVEKTMEYFAEKLGYGEEKECWKNNMKIERARQFNSHNM